ncbi:MAG: hypothetical protein ABTQ32_09305 [Myxococcaceae bacterium]
MTLIPRFTPLPGLGLLGLLVSLAGCGVPEEAAGAAPEPTQTQQALDGRIRYQSSCKPFNASLLERSMQYARVIASTPAFEQCVRNTMAQRYMNCADPNKGLPLATQIDRAMVALETSNNAITFACDDAAGDASASYQGYGTTTEHGVNAHSAHNKELYDWNTYGANAGTADDYQPWNWRASTMLHEFAHTHDYKHMDWNCSTNCGDPSCAWTSTCGGPGTPPPSVTSIGTAGLAQQEFCAWDNLRDDRAYYSRGDPSLAYIITDCAHNMVVQSHEACGKASAAGACTDWSALRLLASWSGNATQEQSNTAMCGCYDDPRKIVSLRTNLGQAVTALNGGGSDMRTNWGTTTGAWQWLYLIDLGGGSLTSADGVQLKTHTGHWLQSNYSASAMLPYNHTIYNVLGGPIINGSTVKFGNVWFNPSTWLNEWRYASAGPSTLTYSSGSGAANNEFILERPRRDTLVHLATNTGSFVRVNASTGTMNGWTNRTAPELQSGTALQQAEAAFWLVDHNGGTLVTGDQVSFETFVNDSFSYLSVLGVGTGQLRTVSGIAATSRFTVTKVSLGDATIRHGDTITLRSSTGNLLTTSGSQLTNSGTTVTAAQRFVLRHVSQHDRSRPTW